MKYRIGDKVRILWSTCDEWGKPGDVGTVLSYDDDEGLYEVGGVGDQYPDGEGWYYEGEALELVAVGRTYTRADLVRAILGQQWAVAIACHDSWGFIREDGGTTLRLADLPSPDDVVTAMEQV